MADAAFLQELRRKVEDPEKQQEMIAARDRHVNEILSHLKPPADKEYADALTAGILVGFAIEMQKAGRWDHLAELYTDSVHEMVMRRLFL
jgi:hypothetical protein